MEIKSNLGRIEKILANKVIIYSDGNFSQEMVRKVLNRYLSFLTTTYFNKYDKDLFNKVIEHYDYYCWRRE